MAYEAKRRRGPNKPRPEVTIGASPEAQTAITEGAPAPAKRRRRASTGGYFKKLDAPERPGFQRRWFNDTPGRLAYAEELAYEHVTEPGIKSDSPDSRVRRLVGTQAGGQPQYAYLMETPIEEYQRGIDEKEEAHRAVDEAIRSGSDMTGRVQDAFGEGSIRTR